MKNKIHLLVLISIFTYVFIFLHTNLDDIVLYKIVGVKYGVDYSLSMNSPTWLDEWNRLLGTNLYSNTPIDIWEQYIINNGLELQGFTESGSFIHNLTNWIKIGLSGIALTLIIFICKKSVFKPIKNLKEYLENRRSFLNSEMDETIKFLENLKNRIVLNESEEKDIHKCNICVEKIPNFITDFDKLKYKPIYAIRLINDIEKSYYRKTLKNEVEEYSNLIDLVINFIKEIKDKEINNKKSKLTSKEFFPSAKRTMEYYSKNSWFYILYCTESNQNKILEKNSIWINYFSLWSILFYNIIFITLLISTTIALVLFSLFNINIISINELGKLIINVLSKYILPLALILIFIIFIMFDLFIYNRPKIIKPKLNWMNEIKFVTFFFSIMCSSIYLYISVFSQFENKELHIISLHDLLMYILYNVLCFSLCLYWFISFTHLIKTERKVSWIMFVKEVMLPICFLILFIITFFLIDNFKTVLLLIIFIWLVIVGIDYIIWNFLFVWFKKLSSKFKGKSHSITQMFLWSIDINKDFLKMDDKKYEVIKYVLMNNPENIEDISKEFKVTREYIENVLCEYLYKDDNNFNEYYQSNILNYLEEKYKKSCDQILDRFDIKDKCLCKYKDTENRIKNVEKEITLKSTKFEKFNILKCFKICIFLSIIWGITSFSLSLYLALHWKIFALRGLAWIICWF